MQYKRFALTAVIAATAMGAANAATEIQWWHSMTAVNNEWVNDLAKQFNESQSEYKVVPTFKGVYDESMTAAIAAFRSGNAPHILQVFEVGTATMMASKGATVPVGKVMHDAGVAFDPKAYIPAVAGYYTAPNGQMLSFPFNSSTTIFYYNKDAFKKAGLNPDKAPTTWPEVFAAAKKLKESGHSCPMTLAWQGWTQLESFSTWHNVEFATEHNGLSANGYKARMKINAPLHVKHIDFLSKLQKDGVMVYVGRKSEAINAFTSGEAGILMNSSGSYAAVKAGAKFQWGVALLPYWPDVKGAPQNTVIGGAAIWAMAGHSKDAEKGAAAFLNYLLKPEVQARFHQLTGYVPVTLEGYELTKQQGFYDKNPGTDIAVKALSDKKPTINSLGLRLGNFVQIRNIIDEELEAVWAGKKTAKQALDAAVERGNAELARFAKANKK